MAHRSSLRPKTACGSRFRARSFFANASPHRYTASMNRLTISGWLMIVVAACASTAEVAPGGRSPEQQAIYESCTDMEPSYPADCADVADSAREFQQAEADSIASGTMDSPTTCKLCTCHDERCVCGDSAPPRCSTCPGWCAPPQE